MFIKHPVVSPRQFIGLAKKAMKILRALGMGLAIIILMNLMGDVWGAFSKALIATFQFQEHAMHAGAKALDASPMLK